jgi:hypothetical protein
MFKKMKVIFLDNDGVICLSNNWGSRFKKQNKWGQRKMSMSLNSIPIEYRFDNFDKKAVEILNEILTATNAEIVVSSDWRLHADLNELKEYYLSQGIAKGPIGMTNKNLADCDVPENFPWSREWDLEQCRSIEIQQYLKDNPEITHWVAVDDLNMGKVFKENTLEFNRSWGLNNFVLTPSSTEGIKQSGIQAKILKYLLD